MQQGGSFSFGAKVAMTTSGEQRYNNCEESGEPGHLDGDIGVTKEHEESLLDSE